MEVAETEHCKVRERFWKCKRERRFFFDAPAHDVRTLYSDARSDTESGSDGGEYGDDDVDDFSPDVFILREKEW